MVQIVRNNFEDYTNNQLDKAILAQKFQAMVGHPTEERFNHMVKSKLLNIFPIKVEYFTNVNTIF